MSLTPDISECLKFATYAKMLSTPYYSNFHLDQGSHDSVTFGLAGHA